MYAKIVKNDDGFAYATTHERYMSDHPFWEESLDYPTQDDAINELLADLYKPGWGGYPTYAIVAHTIILCLDCARAEARANIEHSPTGEDMPDVVVDDCFTEAAIERACHCDGCGIEIYPRHDALTHDELPESDPLGIFESDDGTYRTTGTAILSALRHGTGHRLAPRFYRTTNYRDQLWHPVNRPELGIYNRHQARMLSL